MAAAIRGNWRVVPPDTTKAKSTDADQLTMRIGETNLVRKMAIPPGFVPPLISIGTNAKMTCETNANGKIFAIETFTYRVNARTSPMAIDLTLIDDVGKEYLFKGIFQLQSNKLTICYSTPDVERPKDFAENPNDFSRVKLTFERDKK